MAQTSRRILSPANRTVKALARLKRRRAREQSGEILIEGAREISRALTRVAPLAFLVWEEKITPEEARVLQTHPDIPRILLSEAAFQKIAYRENPSGLILHARVETPRLEALSPGPLVLVAVGIEKPGNLGAMMRTADACGAGLIAAETNVDPYNPNVIRASTGVVFTLPWALASREAALRWLRARGYTLVASSPHARTAYWAVDFTGPTAIIVGPEHTGLDEAWLHAARIQVTIPMYGQADSLNASVSAALLLYEALRQRNSNLYPPA